MSASIRVSSPSRGEMRIVRDGWRSSESVERVARLAEPLLRHPGEMRHHRGAHEGAGVRVAEPRRAGARPRRSRCPRPSTSRGRRASCLVSAPRPAVPGEQVVGRGRAPRAGLVVRERRLVALPGGHDRVDERPSRISPSSSSLGTASTMRRGFITFGAAIIRDGSAMSYGTKTSLPRPAASNATRSSTRRRRARRFMRPWSNGTRTRRDANRPAHPRLEC